MTLRPPVHALRDTSGVTIIEFALIAPVLMIMMFGLLDLAHSMYTAQMLQGSIQKAARDSTIEGASTTATMLDGRVSNAVLAIAPGSTLSFSRKSYSSFTSASRPENYDDLNSNATCDKGEAFEDANKNGTWDKDIGITGFGGARDAVLYTVTVGYKLLFPIAAFIPGQAKTITMTATNVLRNQPYGSSASTSKPPTGNCS